MTVPPPGQNGWNPPRRYTWPIALLLIVLFSIGPKQADGHLIRYPDHPTRSVLENREASQERNLGHARYVCEEGASGHKRWACKARVWVARELRETRRVLHPPVTNWAAIQMHYGDRLAHDSAGDPWPNCPDPHDGSGSSWYGTVACENNGNWLDSPGYYRCGLQFDPMWERHYGRRFCP